MTWGYEFAEGPYCVSGYCSPEFSGYFDMQAHLTAAYTDIAFEVGAMLAPVGEAFAAALILDPGSPLWLPDNYHPSAEGSYLAACVFFTRVFSESPIGLNFFGGLDPARALFYQEVAAEASGLQQVADPSFKLFAQPNPFNPKTQIGFQLTSSSLVDLSIYDAQGRRVKQLLSGFELPAGPHVITWRGQDDMGRSLPSGIYHASIEAKGLRSTRKLCLLK